MRFRAEVVRTCGGEVHKRTINVPKSVSNVRDYITHKLYMLLQKPPHRCTEAAFWKSWELLQYYRA